jgi:hypothetical protein
MTTGDNYFYTLQEICVLLNLLPNTFRQIAREYADIIVPQEQVRKGRSVMGLPPEGFEAFRLVVQMRGRGASGVEIRAAVAGVRAARVGRPGLAVPVPGEARERAGDTPRGDDDDDYAEGTPALADPVQAGRAEPRGEPAVGPVGLKAELDEGAWARYREALGADAALPRKARLAPARAEAPPSSGWEAAREALAEAAAAAEPAPASGRGFAELPEAYRRLDEPRPRAGRVELEWPRAEPEARVVEPEARVVEPEARVAEPEARVAEPEARVAEPEARVAEPEARIVEPEVLEEAVAPVVAPDAPEGAEMAASGPAEPVADGQPAPEAEPVPDTWDVDRAGEIAAGPVVGERALLAEMGSLRDELRQMDEKRQEERDKLITALMRTQHELQSLRYEVGATLSRRDRKRKRGFLAWLFDA